MLVLDTNYLTELLYGSPRSVRIRERLALRGEDFVTTVVTAEELTRGRLAEIKRHPQPHDQIEAYARLQQTIELVAAWTLLPWDEEAANHFACLRRGGVRIGTLDLKIACTTLAHDATLLTRNTSDFAQVPGLHVENWLD